MGALTTAGANDALTDALINNSLYLCLFTQDPGAGGSLTHELTGNNYSRQLVPFGTPTTGEASNNASVIFQPASDDWLEATHGGLANASSGGTLMQSAELYQPLLCAKDESVRFSVGTVFAYFGTV